MTEMIQRQKNKSLVLKVSQRLTGFESLLNTSLVPSLLQTRKGITDLYYIIIMKKLL